jgi:hypothetical protein
MERRRWKGRVASGNRDEKRIRDKRNEVYLVPRVLSRVIEKKGGS